jgi:Outer membrane protein beta-barrel domain
MVRQRFGIAVLIVMAFLASNATAQRNEIAGSIGRIFISDQGVLGADPTNPNIHFGNGLSYEANFSRRYLDIGLLSVNVEVPFVFTPTVKLNFGQNIVPKSFRSYFVTPAARVNFFPSTGFSPWVSIGGGFGHFGESSELEFGGTNPGQTGTTTGVFQAGFGLDVKILDKLKLRGEVRDFNSGVPQLNANTGKSRQHNIFAGAGVVFSF